MILELLLWGLMATNNFDSGHAIIPVAHPSGEVHNIAVPDGTDMGDFHAALGEAGYHHDLPEPKKEGALEYSPEFKQTAKRIWSRVTNGKAEGEAGTYFTAEGKSGDVQQSPGGYELSVKAPKSAPYVIHTHPDKGTDKPSPPDVASAKKYNKTIYVVSRSGLWSAEPDGNFQRVFKSPTWYEDKEPK